MKTKPHPHKLPPETVASIKRLWPEAGGNASEVARLCGCSESSVRRYVVREGLPGSGEIYARALERGERDARRLVRQAQRKVAAALETARGAKAIADLTRAATATLHTATSAKLAHGKLSGTIVDRSEVNATVTQVAVVQVVKLPPRVPLDVATVAPALLSGGDDDGE